MPTSNAAAVMRDADGRAQCPLCLLLGQPATVFRMGIYGWDKHIAAPGAHPEWHPEIKDGAKRKKLFKEQFPDFMKLGLTATNKANRRAAWVANRSEQRKKRRKALKMPPAPAALLQKKKETGGASAPGVFVDRGDRAPASERRPMVAAMTAEGVQDLGVATLDVATGQVTVVCPHCQGAGRIAVGALPGPTVSP